MQFINDEHREMHEVLLQNGFTFKENAESYPYGFQWNFVYIREDCTLMFDWSDKEVQIDYSNSSFDFRTLNNKPFKEVTAYFTQNGQIISTLEKSTTVAQPIEVITPELLVANGWRAEKGYWEKKGVEFRFVALDGQYYRVTIGSNNHCITSQVDAVLGFLKAYGLEFQPITYVEVLKNSGFIEVGNEGALRGTQDFKSIYIERHPLDDNAIIVRCNKGRGFLNIPKNNPLMMIQAAKFLSEIV